MQEFILFPSANVWNYLETVSCVKWPGDVYVEIVSTKRLLPLKRELFYCFQISCQRLWPKSLLFFPYWWNYQHIETIVTYKFQMDGENIFPFWNFRQETFWLVTQKLNYMPVKFHTKRTILYKFILLLGGVTL